MSANSLRDEIRALVAAKDSNTCEVWVAGQAEPAIGQVSQVGEDFLRLLPVPINRGKPPELIALAYVTRLRERKE